jgi:porin
MCREKSETARKKPASRTLALILFALFTAHASGLVHAQTPAEGEGSPLYDPLASPLSSDNSIAPVDPRLYEFKKALLDLGYNFQVNYTGEVAANPVGGAQQGADYEGLLELGVDGDLNRIAGLQGAWFHINAFEIHGRGLTTYNIFNFSTISGIEAHPTMRLFEVWFEQKLFGGLASIRIGQLSADSEFLLSDFDALYWNGTFGWPNLTSFDLPGTGPHYPVATPGVRLKIKPNDHVALLIALFNGDPAGVGLDTGATETQNPSGINFRLKDPPFLIGQAEFTYSLPIAAQGLAGKVRIGGWHHFGPFNDSFGVAFSYNRVSPSVSALDRVAASFSDLPVPVRDYEILFEATYQAQRSGRAFSFSRIFNMSFIPAAARSIR